MDNIRTSIEILFKKKNPEEILNKYYNNIKKIELDRNDFLAKYIYEKLDFYSRDEVENVFDILESNWKRLNEVKDESIFNVLVNFTKDILIENRCEPVCKYEKLFKWRELSYQLGEDLLTTVNFAYRDYLIDYNRTMFTWKAVVGNDNNQLKEILSRGCAENHFHLKGSAPHFQLSWISLMNNISGRDKEFEKLRKKLRLSPNISFSFNEYSFDMKFLVKKAVAIRWFLYKKFVLQDKIDEDILSKFNMILQSKSNSELKLFIDDIQKEINVLKNSFGKKFGEDIGDYAIPRNISSSNKMENILLYGERYFLYSIFKRFFRGDKELLKYKRLIHAYIIIKEKFRDELIQINNRVGFANFEDYQDRKGYFLGKDIYKNAVVKMAVDGSMKNQGIKHLEARIAPKNSSVELYKEIKKLDSSIGRSEKEERDYFYVIHFIKIQEKYRDVKKDNMYNLSSKARNYKVRDGLKKQADAIIKLRKSSSELKKRIYGIDAANFEIGCRPEVFAQCFRYLRNYRIENRFENFEKDEIFNLGITYHAGEDFLSIADGLRAIDETMRFLSYEQGDRLGHALALGEDVRRYYEDKNFVLIMPKQVNLDNITWILGKAREYGIAIEESLKSDIQDNYYRLYSEIYNETIDEECSPENYYRAWKLRGDNPERYISGEYDDRDNMTFWEKCDIDSKKELVELRKNKKLCKLYMAYHYNKDVKENGMISEEVKVSHKMIKLIEDLQLELAKEIARKNIGIESNPSSNYVIGRFKKYEGHPISKYYNLGLDVSEEERDKCQQLSVSINTDDQGVFATYLENEYALIALAMEKMKDENGDRVHKAMNVYEWIDRIRRMGLEQSFQRRERR